MIKYGVLLSFIFLIFCGCNSHKSSNSDDHESTFPKPDHVIIVIEENHGFDQIIGSPDAPFINSLIEEGALFTDSRGVTHPSQANYIALYSGSLQGVEGDECLEDTSFTSPNLGFEIIQAGYTFKGYGETMPSEGKACYYKKSLVTDSYLYGRKHCPWVNWLGTGRNQLPDSISLPMSEFPTDYNNLPTVAFVIPNMDNDMHNEGSDPATIRRSDDWLKDNLSEYIKWANSHNSLFILTYDEDDFTPQNEIPTIFTGAMVKAGTYSDSINHYNVLRTIEKMYDLPNSGSAQANEITQVWNQPMIEKQ